MAGRISIAVYDAAFQRVGWIGAPKSLEMTVRHNLPGDATVVLPARHRHIDRILAAGARLLISYYPDDGVAPIRLSGAAYEIEGEGTTAGAVRTFRLEDDWNTVFRDIVGWPNPTGTPAQQGDDSAYFTRQGSAESVAKQIIAPNALRQGVPLTIPPSLGRGSTIRVQIRMHQLMDRLFPAINQAGIGLRVVVDDTSHQLLLETYVPQTYPRVLTQESGVLAGGGFKASRPTTTRVIVGAGGEGTQRIFREYIDVAREAEWKGSRAKFVDARDVSSEWEAAKADVAEKAKSRDEARRDLDVAKVDYKAADRAFKNADELLKDKPADSTRQSNRAEALTARTEAATAQTTATTAYNAAVAALTAAAAAVPARLAEMYAEMQARADEALAEGAPTVTVTSTLSESRGFKFGKTFGLGDVVSVRIAGSPVLTNTVAEAQITWDKTGIRVAPVVGEWLTANAQLMQLVAEIAAGQRDLRSST